MAQSLRWPTRLGEEAEPGDRLLARRVGAPEREGESGAAPRARCRATGEVDQARAPGRREPARVVQGDGRAEGMPDQVDILSTQMLQERF